MTEDLNLLPFDDIVALKASDVYRTLKQQNKQIGLSDILIAATCLVYDQPILTSNKKHFQLVDGLKIAV